MSLKLLIKKTIGLINKIVKEQSMLIDLFKSNLTQINILLKKMMTFGKKIFNFSIFSLNLIACISNQNDTLSENKSFNQNLTESRTYIAPKNKNIIYHGRVNHINGNESVIYWSGSGISIWFEGTSVAIILDDLDGSNYYNAIIDNYAERKIIIDCIQGEQIYEIANDLEPGIHRLELTRRTDASSPATIFKGVLIDLTSKIVEPQYKKELKIEFYGNSITSGHGILDETRVRNDDKSTWDNYFTYAASTARALNADFRCISMSGIGIMISWYPLIMPELFDRLDPRNALLKWDFSTWKADIVVINLLQNDAWLINNLSPVPNDQERINAYKNFIKKIRMKYEDALIICTLGNMDACKEGSVWTNYVEMAVKDLSDNKIFYVPMTYKNTEGHPTVIENKEMADVLIPFIKSKIGI
ncbi:MAG: electron transporter RnfD [Flammeovirgaceae bacterium]|nr:electron transporter RnfD [Flammeovirgaceae bacterium]|tara:strand:- start:12825 stop:14069 length:1245 start_codon:yes stop_codon:yes gene_type:complete